MKDRIFDPRDLDCKSPYGAVPSGTPVRFALRPPRSEGFSRAVLLARFEFWDGEERAVPLPWEDTALGRDRFAGTLDTTGYVGLVWYRFRLERLDGGFELLDKDGGSWQLTVYDGSWTTPEWFGAGVTYHIFPDRFHRLAPPSPADFPDRRVHADWSGVPDYLPDESGRIRNADYFGGSLSGVEEKLDVLCALGVETLYFCPIFEAAENHRYGTADYERVDPMLGTNEAFFRLCAEAKARGVRVMLDGVFSHVGAVSRYFNADGRYPDRGAAQGEDSPYFDWFQFSRWPDRYDCWWGIPTLPAVREMEPSYLAYMTEGPDSIVRRWLRAGASGWRLDVADELPDAFVHAVYTAARAENPEAVIIGEVWEDGSNKISYDTRRRHLLGGHLDGLMNYPFRQALIRYLRGGDASCFQEELETLREHYPRAAFYSAMNSLSTHDTPRILTLLGASSDLSAAPRQVRAEHRLSPEERRRGLALTRLAALVLFAFPGSPTIFYGDEAGMEGWEDPFNRRPYPWGREESSLVAWFCLLGRLRKDRDALRRGDLEWRAAEGGLLAFSRVLEGERLTAVCNRGETPARLSLGYPARDLLTGEVFSAGTGVDAPPLGCLLLEAL